MRKVNIGATEFEFLRSRNSIYVDKTEFIREWWDSYAAVTLIARPRGFGKTVNLDMVNCFFSTQYNNRSDLFEGLDIWKYPKYREIQGTWPVLFLSFADENIIKSRSYEEVMSAIKKAILNLYIKHAYVLESSCLTDYEKEQYRIACKSDIPDHYLDAFLQNLMKCLSKVYHKKVIMLLDAYDTPWLEAKKNGYTKKLADGLNVFFLSTFKVNPYLERGLITGITAISRFIEPSYIADLNNLYVITTSDRKFATAFGFTEQEVLSALTEQHLSSYEQPVKEWYGGYTFGEATNIYNPRSVTKFLDLRELSSDNRVHSDSKNSNDSNSDTLENALFREGSPSILETMEDLLPGKTLSCCIEEEVEFESLEYNSEVMCSFLLAAGYLKIVKAGHWDASDAWKRPEYTFSLANREMHTQCCRYIREWFADCENSYDAFLKCLLVGDLEKMNAYMNDISRSVFDSLDTVTVHKPSSTEPSNTEWDIIMLVIRFIIRFVLRLTVEWMDRYSITTYHEIDYEKYDVVLQPKNEEDPAFVLAFRVYSPRKEIPLKQRARDTLQQMETSRYDADLAALGISKERIRNYVFAFDVQRQRVLIL